MVGRCINFLKQWPNHSPLRFIQTHVLSNYLKHLKNKEDDNQSSFLSIQLISLTLVVKNIMWFYFGYLLVTKFFYKFIKIIYFSFIAAPGKDIIVNNCCCFNI